MREQYNDETDGSIEIHQAQGGPKHSGDLSRRFVAAGGGLTLLAIGAVFLIAALDMRLGSVRRMGPGFIPVSLSSLFLMIGAVLTAQGFIRCVPPDRANWRPFVMITASLLVFAVAIDRFGLVPSVVATVFTASLSSSEVRAVGTVLLAAAVALICWAIFILGLGMTVPIVRFRL